MSGGVRRVAKVLTVLLLVAALVLAVVVAVQAFGGKGSAVESGEVTKLRTQPYGREVTVEVPGRQVQLRIGEPVGELDPELLDSAGGFSEEPLAAPDDGALVPLSLLVGGGAATGTDEEAPPPVELVLVAGDQRIDLEQDEEASSWTSVAVAIGDADADLTVEVTFDGLTQQVDVDSGRVDAGGAASLYEPGVSLGTGCEDVVTTSCELAAAPGSRLQPDRSTVKVDPVALSPYSAELGWADEGERWAFVRVFLLGSYTVQNARGDYWTPQEGQPVVTLDGAEPASDDLEPDQPGYYGTLTFAVDADTVPRELEIAQVLRLPPDAGRATLPVSATVTLQER